MDAVLKPGYKTEQSFVPNKQIKIKTPKKNQRGNFVSNHSDQNLDIYAGLLNPPPPPPPHTHASFSSYPLSASVLFNHQLYPQNQLQPPLLPLPSVSAIHHHHLPQLSRSLSSPSQGLSLPPSSRKNRTTRDMSLAPKRLSKPTKREEVDNKKRTSSATQSISEFLVVASDNRWGPDPNDLPKHNLPVVLTSSSSSSSSTGLTGKGFGTVSAENMDSSVFNLAPPPSSLPLPKFYLRSKLSCNAEAAGVDAGATNNLRRLLRLR